MFLRKGLNLVHGFHQAIRTWNNRNACRLSSLAGRGLIPKHPQMADFRSNKEDAFFLTPLGKGLVLTQEAITRVDGVDPLGLGQTENAFNIQVGLSRIQILTNQVGLVCLEPVEGTNILLGIDCDCLDV